MSQVALVYPLLLQVALTFILLLWMAQRRTSALASNEVHPRDIALGQPGWPERTTQIGNCFHNQLEVPVLFYILVLLVLHLRMSDIVHVVLAWAFVLSRYAHAFIHTTHNRVSMRGAVYGIGVMILLAMWIWFAIRFLTASAPL
jgi:hypothetical protein